MKAIGILSVSAPLRAHLAHRGQLAVGSGRPRTGLPVLRAPCWVSTAKEGLMWRRWVFPGLAAVGLLSGCGSSDGEGGGAYTLRVEVTSSGSPLAFTGTFSLNNEQKMPISGMTPFALNIPDRKESCSGFTTS